MVTILICNLLTSITTTISSILCNLSIIITIITINLKGFSRNGINALEKMLVSTMSGFSRRVVDSRTNFILLRNSFSNQNLRNITFTRWDSLKNVLKQNSETITCEVINNILVALLLLQHQRTCQARATNKKDTRVAPLNPVNGSPSNKTSSSYSPT
jgi:hypothetical protein